ncbi:MAG: hypothetical protein NTY90_00895 [Candidatus Micrarchaeota archaeon]|nr:hypothetical protein [Candidatus Micrarchaeota archaeon]
MERLFELGDSSSVEDIVLGAVYKGITGRGKLRLNRLVAGTLEGAPAGLGEGETVIARFVKRKGHDPVFSFIRAGGAEAGAERVEKTFAEKTAAGLADAAGERVKVRGKLVCVVKAGVDKGFLLDGTGAAVVQAEGLEEGVFVEAAGEAKPGLPPIVAAERVTLLNGPETREIGEKIAGYLEENSKPFAAGTLVDDEVMRGLSGPIRECARFLRRRLLEFQPVMIRYHGDADGVCSALLVFSAMRKFLSGARVSLQENRFLVSAAQTDSAIYSQTDLAVDAEKAAALPKKPVFVFLDHAANHESIGQIERLGEGGYEIVIVDHHPPAPGVEKTAKHFISPFVAGGSSHYTAGLLCFELASAIAGPADERLARISLQGDKSVFAPKEPLKEPRVIDYLAAYNAPESLEFYENVLSDAKKIDYYFEEANNRINRLVAASKPFTRQKAVGNAAIAVVNLGKFCKKGEYPPKGAVLTEIQRTIPSSGPVVSVGYGGDAILFRANHDAHEAGFRASTLISLLKTEFPHAVVSGGGHDVAASMRVKEEFLQAVLERTLQLIEETLSKTGRAENTAPPKQSGG